MPLLVQNNEPNTTVFSKVGMQPIVWAMAGDPNGGDVQRVPDNWADDIDFLNALDRGTLTLLDSSNPEISERLAKQSAVFRERREAAASQQTAVLDRRQDRDLTSVGCIGPHSNGRGVEDCGELVLLRAANLGEVPPLCGRHKHLINEFYLVESGSAGESHTDRPAEKSRTWKRVTMTAPVRG